MADKAHQATDEQLAEMEKRISAIYTEAEKGIREKWDSAMKQVEKKIDKLQTAYDEAKAAGADRGELISLGRKLAVEKKNQTIMNQRFQNMVEDTAIKLSHVNEIATEYVNGQLPTTYAFHYNSFGESISESVPGYSFDLIDESTVKRLVENKDILLPYKQIDAAKDIKWNMDAINSQILQGILTGDSIPKIATRIQTVEGMNEHAAVRTARTMITAAENLGRMDMLRDANDDGVETNKIWQATLDNRTRHEHAALDGQERAADDPFEVDGYSIMYPGDVDAAPEMVYNCRCTLRYKVVGFKKIVNDSVVYAADREEAMEILKEKVHFRNVTDNLNLMPEDTFVAQVNQLYKLNEKFGVIDEGHRGKLSLEKLKTGDLAEVYHEYFNHKNDLLKFSLSDFSKELKDIETLQKWMCDTFWNMPCKDENLGIYTVTHEFGHLLESKIVSTSDVALQRKSNGEELRKIFNGESVKIKNAIIKIAKEMKADFFIEDELSEYGRTNPREFFAEVFANSQLGDPDVLGDAMNVWLERNWLKK